MRRCPSERRWRSDLSLQKWSDDRSTIERPAVYISCGTVWFPIMNRITFMNWQTSMEMEGQSAGEQILSF